MSVRTYNPSVRVGNWNEDIQLEEDTLKDFLEKRAKGELLIQKTHRLYENILKKVDLSISRDGFVHFGDVVMIMNKGAEDKTKYSSGVDPRGDSAICANMSESKMYEANKIEGPCGVSGSRMLEPCVRNAFVITSIDGTPNETPLMYNQPFHLKTTPDKGGDLLLFSDRATFQNSAKRSRHQEVCLVPEASYLTQWMVLPFNPQLRMEYELAPVPANEKVVIVHCKTNNALCVESDFLLKTPFGREYEITSFTSLDSHKAEKDINHMHIVMGVPGDDVYPVIPQSQAPEISKEFSQMTNTSQ
ncbi:cilia- and flagella-associated protein 161 [Lingula anatina]|uniref:Cilia- and flagella-associated protein 161 n=1 Tax=Lingula anatina TaxID=7574 RepID=A0A1S3HAD9_LINAN|nr:cilia- and flagella-associated protein 161 [Lingula anatina]|eukprot:XP_013383002.1 cilia- and flagella-associated protein 161 [Lingula anatina]